MKRLSVIFLMLLALFVAVPRQACACDEAQATQKKQHSCCEKKESSGSCDSSSSKEPVFKHHSCCGMGADKTISLANSISILPESESFADSISILSDLPAFLIAVASDAPAHPNRAPPRIRGMGTTKTYLYKQVFLI